MAIRFKTHLIIEKMYGMIIQFETQSFQEGDIICHDLLIRYIKLVNYYRVHVVIAQ